MLGQNRVIQELFTFEWKLCGTPGGEGGWGEYFLNGEAPPERGIFFRLHKVYERVGISLVLNERVGKSFISVIKRPKGLTDTFYGCEKVEKTFWLCDILIFQRQWIYSC